MIVVGMSCAAYNDMKAEARDFEGSEDDFAASFMSDSYVNDMARRAYRKAKA
jgi:hypothetical protein